MRERHIQASGRRAGILQLAAAMAGAVIALAGCGGSSGTSSGSGFSGWDANAAKPPAYAAGPGTTGFWDIYGAPRADAQAGDIYWAQPRSDAPDGANAWNVIYVSEIQPGVKKYVSGEIYVPATRNGQQRDVVLWNHETTGVADACAPSRRSLVVDGVSRVPAIQDLLSQGYVVAMSSPTPVPRSTCCGRCRTSPMRTRPSAMSCTAGRRAARRRCGPRPSPAPTRRSSPAWALR